MTRALQLHHHPEIGVQSPAGGLYVAGGPVSAAEDLHSEVLAEESWWSETWTKACAPEVTQAELQSWEQIGPLG